MPDIFSTPPSEVTESEAKDALQKKEQELSAAKNWSADPNKDRPKLQMPEVGWKVLPLDTLPSRGKYYPENFELQIKPATSKEVRHFSSVDENDPLDIQEKIHFIIKNNTRCTMPSHSYKDIEEIDKFAVLYAIRGITFKESPHLITRLQCNFCGEEADININSDNFMQFSIDKELERFYNAEEGAFKFKMANGFEFSLYLPTIGIAEYVATYITNHGKQNKWIDTDFLNIAPYLFRTYKLLETDKLAFQQKAMSTLKWNSDEMSIVTTVIDVLRKSVDPNVIYKCASCGEVNKQNVSFPNGIKGLFIVHTTDIFSKFL